MHGDVDVTGPDSRCPPMGGSFGWTKTKGGGSARLGFEVGDSSNRPVRRIVIRGTCVKRSLYMSFQSTRATTSSDGRVIHH